MAVLVDPFNTNDLLSEVRLERYEAWALELQGEVDGEVPLRVYKRHAADVADLIQVFDEAGTGKLFIVEDDGRTGVGDAPRADVGLDNRFPLPTFIGSITVAQRDAIAAPLSGMLAFVSDLGSGQFQGFHASSWLTVGKQDLGADLGDTTVSNPGATITFTGADGITTTGDDTAKTITLGLDLYALATGAPNILRPDTAGNIDLGSAALPWGKGFFDDDVTIGTGSFAGTFTHAITADRTWTFPDITGTVILDAGAQTIGGIKTFSSRPIFNAGATVTDGQTFGWSDVLLSRGAANQLDLASGDSLNLVNGSILTGTDAADLGTAALRWDLFSSDVRVYNAASDANPSIRLNGLLLSLGPGGATAPDWTLNRASANLAAMGTNDSLLGVGSVVSSRIFQVDITGDSNPRWTVQAGGVHEFGAGGASATDTFWERKSTKQLQVRSATAADGSVVAAVGTGTAGIFIFTDSSSANAVSALFETTFGFGPGGGSGLDVVLSRGAANRLDLASGDSFRIVSGQLQFSTDVVVDREAADILRVNDSLHVTVDLEVDGALNHDGTTIGFFGIAPTTQQASIAEPSGGVVIDAQARTAINSILNVLDAYGLTA
jgi:hypothetical protein